MTIGELVGLLRLYPSDATVMLSALKAIDVKKVTGSIYNPRLNEIIITDYS